MIVTLFALAATAFAGLTAGAVIGALAAHRRHFSPSYRERWQQACRVNEKQYEALEQAVNALEAEDAKARGRAVMDARSAMRARVNKDWDAKAKKNASKRDLLAAGFLPPRRSPSPADLRRLRRGTIGRQEWP